MFNDYLRIFVDRDYPFFIDKYLETKTLERLKYIGFFCGLYYTKIYDARFFYSRFQHSLVVAHMTWHFTHDKKETIAALLHDAGTPVFAHIIDYLFGDYQNQESAEKNICDIIRDDEKLLGFLKSDGLRIEDFTDLSGYPILENKSPRLCTDRLDGVLGTVYIWLQKRSLNEVKEIYDNLTILINEDGKYELGFDNIKIALKFVEMVYLYAKELQGNKDKYLMKYIADALKKVIDMKLITIDDLYNKREEDVVEVLEQNVRSWKIFREATNIKSSDDLPQGYYVAVNNVKKRNVIPLIKLGNEMKRIDKVSQEAEEIYESYRRFKDKKYAFIEGIK